DAVAQLQECSEPSQALRFVRNERDRAR
ncbi:MAG: hypothetical protein QOF37_864, partial [Thermoleophilaceae bacterium]|nr:hypothetical protein [Thermoleophilaceae bacterium]